MKNTIKTLVLIVATAFIISCDNNDDAQTTPPTPTDGFTVAGIFYPTPNCYIEFDEDFDPNLDQFNFFFTNGRMYDNVNPTVSGSTAEYLYTLNTSNFVFINVREQENPSITNPSYPNIQTGIPYIGGDSDSVIVTGAVINDIGFTTNGINFGEGDDSSAVPVAQNGNPIMTINSYSYDIQTQTGSVNVDYIYNGIIGHYEGSFGIILD